MRAKHQGPDVSSQASAYATSFLGALKRLTLLSLSSNSLFSTSTILASCRWQMAQASKKSAHIPNIAARGRALVCITTQHKVSNMSMYSTSPDRPLQAGYRFFRCHLMPFYQALPGSLTKQQICIFAQGTRQVAMQRRQAMEVRAYIVQHDADEHVEGYSEEVDDSRTALFWHILAAHLHHAGPEDADACLKHTEGQQLDLAFEGDPCQHISSASACATLCDCTQRETDG